MHYHVGHNMPGYLPESDVSVYEDIDRAINSLIWELESVADYADEWANGHECDDSCANGTRDHCPRRWATDLGSLLSYLTEDRAITVAGGDFLGYAADQAWWIEPCSEDCDMEEVN